MEAREGGHRRAATHLLDGVCGVDLPVADGGGAGEGDGQQGSAPTGSHYYGRRPLCIMSGGHPCI